MGGRVVALAGGVGAARFLEGLASVVAPESLTIVGNVGDDAEIHGLHISPDLDTVTYTLAGLVHEEQGWGLRDETFHCLDALGRLGAETWFRLGDQDIATHLFRTDLLRAGVPLSEVTARICRAFGIRSRLLPATDGRLRTRVETGAGLLDFQVYFVQRRALDPVSAVFFDGAEEAQPAPGVLEAIMAADAIIVCPSNPIISIGPILAVRGIRDALRATPARVAAISPIVGGRALKGPADRMMAGLGMPACAAQIARLYEDFLDLLVLDQVDAAEAEAVRAAGVEAGVTDTIMATREKKIALARFTAGAAGL